MNISLQNGNDVSAVLTVKMEKADYQPNVDKALKGLRQRIDMPGFRRGMVPMSIIKKRFGTSVKVEEIEKLLQKNVTDYIKENKVDMLGSPLPKPSEQDLETAEELTFDYDIALAPKFEVALSTEDMIDYYDIDVTDEMVQSQINVYTRQKQTYEKVEEYANEDMIKGDLAELDENGNEMEDGIKVTEAIMIPAYLKNEEEKAAFNGAKLNGTIVFNPSKAYEDNDVAFAGLLKISKEEAENHKGNFAYKITEITRTIPAELNQELFDSVLGEGVVSSEEEFRQKVRENVAGQYVADSDYKFLVDARTYITNKVGELKFADDLMKRIMLMNNEDKDEKYIEENYDKGIEGLAWHLIKEKLVKAYGVKVEDADIKNMAKAATRAQFAQYGMFNVPDSLLDNYASEMLKKQESVEGLVNRAVDSKLTAAMKGAVTLNHKPVSVEEFNKMFEQK